MADRTGLRAEPSRTCVGCRGTDSWSALLRVVAATDAAPGGSSPVVLLPDPRHRLPGRGAWVHPVPGCLELAVRRKAFGRALRLRAAVELSAVTDHLDTLGRGATEQKGGPRPVTRQQIHQRTNKAG